MELFLKLALSLFTVYLLLEWVLPWIWYPHLGRHSHPKKLPQELAELTEKWNLQAKTDEEFLQLVMDRLKSHYRFGHLTQFLHPTRWFETDLQKIWKDRQLPQLCTIYNYLLESILLNSGRFKREQIRHRTVFLNFSMHQFIEISLKNKQKLELDPWAFGMGLNFGKGAKGFV